MFPMTTIELASVKANTRESSAKAPTCGLPPITLHPHDYELLTKAAAIAGYDIKEFAKLVIFRTCQSVVDGDPSDWMRSLPVPSHLKGTAACA